MIGLDFNFKSIKKKTNFGKFKFTQCQLKSKNIHTSNINLLVIDPNNDIRGPYFCPRVKRS
ncbi:hypothetical protein DERP_013672 [Dermatophagoides pteronyssinus]|uniref:Uncharacterized protein n=1 Tax=Dermatophagoides pteronyssinus TaxID=6956 RepID=A0ABQ8JVQ5_DERPT|nr:hypothetical protein DERP_013672 [Dermatophagoides pteronyssinus]